MKKITIIGLVLLLLISVSISVYAKELLPPTNVKVLSQSAMKDFFLVTVIDLSNNEVVLLSYRQFTPFLKLLDVCRTGMFVDPKEQQPFRGVDAPIGQDEAKTR